MVKSALSIFFGLVLLMLVVQHPEKVVEFLQMVVDAAHGLANAITQIKPGGTN